MPGKSGELLPLVEHRLTHLLLKIYPVRLPVPAEIPAEWKAFTKGQIETEARQRRFENLLLEVF